MTVSTRILEIPTLIRGLSPRVFRWKEYSWELEPTLAAAYKVAVKLLNVGSKLVAEAAILTHRTTVRAMTTIDRVALTRVVRVTPVSRKTRIDLAKVRTTLAARLAVARTVRSSARISVSSTPPLTIPMESVSSTMEKTPSLQTSTASLSVSIRFWKTQRQASLLNAKYSHTFHLSWVV